MKTATIFLICLAYSSYGQEKEAISESILRGKEVYSGQCMSCHMAEGEGIADLYPPLSKSDYLMSDKQPSIHNIIHGMTGEIIVNGKTYNMEMTPFDFLSDQEVSDVLNYIRNSWGNEGEAVTPEEVAAVRTKTPKD